MVDVNLVFTCHAASEHPSSMHRARSPGYGEVLEAAPVRDYSRFRSAQIDPRTKNFCGRLFLGDLVCRRAHRSRSQKKCLGRQIVLSGTIVPLLLLEEGSLTSIVAVANLLGIKDWTLTCLEGARRNVQASYVFLSTSFSLDDSDVALVHDAQ